MSVRDKNVTGILSDGRLKPKKRSLVERELETNLTARVTSPVSHNDSGSTSRYGRSRRLKSDTDNLGTEKLITRTLKSPGTEKSPATQCSPVYKMHASNSPIRIESPKKVITTDANLENQIENIYHENISLSRFGSEEKKIMSPVKKFSKIYVRKDMIQKVDSEEIVQKIFSSGKKSSSHLNNILERSSDKYSLNGNVSLNSNRSKNGQIDTSSVVKTLDFDSGKKKRENRDSKSVSKSEMFEIEAKCEYQVGDLAWARVGTYPFWPCIVTREPMSGVFVKKKLFGRVEHDIIHVTFFGDNGRRGWIVDNMLRKYVGVLEFEATKEGFTAEAKKKDPKFYAAFFISEKKLPQWNISVEEAETLLREPKRLRIDILNEMLQISRSSKSGATRGNSLTARTNSDVSLSESLYDTLFSEDDGKSDDIDRSRNKTRKKSLDVSEVVTACLDNMAAKTGITKIQRQSHMDRWLQKAKSKTPEKSQPKTSQSNDKSFGNNLKKKRKLSPENVPSEKPNKVSVFKNYFTESHNTSQNYLKSYENEHDYTSPTSKSKKQSDSPKPVINGKEDTSIHGIDETLLKKSDSVTSDEINGIISYSKDNTSMNQPDLIVEEIVFGSEEIACENITVVENDILNKEPTSDQDNGKTFKLTDDDEKKYDSGLKSDFDATIKNDITCELDKIHLVDIKTEDQTESCCALEKPENELNIEQMSNETKTCVSVEENVNINLESTTEKSITDIKIDDKCKENKSRLDDNITSNTDEKQLVDEIVPVKIMVENVCCKNETINQIEEYTSILTKESETDESTNSENINDSRKELCPESTTVEISADVEIDYKPKDDNRRLHEEIQINANTNTECYLLKVDKNALIKTTVAKVFTETESIKQEEKYDQNSNDKNSDNSEKISLELVTDTETDEKLKNKTDQRDAKIVEEFNEPKSSSQDDILSDINDISTEEALVYQEDDVNFEKCAFSEEISEVQSKNCETNDLTKDKLDIDTNICNKYGDLTNKIIDVALDATSYDINSIKLLEEQILNKNINTDSDKVSHIENEVAIECEGKECINNLNNGKIEQINNDIVNKQLNDMTLVPDLEKIDPKENKVKGRLETREEENVLLAEQIMNSVNRNEKLVEIENQDLQTGKDDSRINNNSNKVLDDKEKMTVECDLVKGIVDNESLDKRCHNIKESSPQRKIKDEYDTISINSDDSEIFLGKKKTPSKNSSRQGSNKINKALENPDSHKVSYIENEMAIECKGKDCINRLNNEKIEQIKKNIVDKQLNDMKLVSDLEKIDPKENKVKGTLKTYEEKSVLLAEQVMNPVNRNEKLVENENQDLQTEKDDSRINNNSNKVLDDEEKMTVECDLVNGITDNESLDNICHNIKESCPQRKIKDEYDTISINSEDSEISLGKKKTRSKNSSRQGSNNMTEALENPDFLQYLELRQDTLIDENPQLTQEEIVNYLYKTWLYEENLKSDTKKTDEMEHSNLVKGLKQEPVQKPKKARRKKAEKEPIFEVEVDEELPPKDKPKRKLAKPFYNYDCSDIEEEIEMFEIFKSKKVLKPQKSESSTSEAQKLETDNQNFQAVKKDEAVEVIEEISSDVEYDEVEEYFKQLTKPKPNLFKGLVRERVCDICERPTNLVKCKVCRDMFHVDCVKKQSEIVEATTPTRGRKKKKKPRGRKPKSLDDSSGLDSESHSDTKSQDANLSEEYLNMSIEEVMEQESHIVVNADDFEAHASVKMQELFENPTVSNYYNNDCDIQWKVSVTGHCEIVDVKFTNESIDTDNSNFKCYNCQKYNLPVCFVCKLPVSPKNQVEHRQKCQVGFCNKYYHLECLDHWPQTQFNSGECRSKGNAQFEPLTCARHVCHTCVSDDPRGCKTRFSSDKLARCIRCPATYHCFTKCLPAGTQILTGSYIICPRHYEHRPGKVPCHVNTGWCFICALGGSLICCEYCPTSFHAECLNIKPPEGGYMCEDCETGRLPLYGEMVWVKLGHYRWWPGIILHPSEIPHNIMAVKHSLGEFVVRFFGQYDYYWVNRGRVFPFQEGDSGKVSSQKSKIDEAFSTAMEHAKRACETLKGAEPNVEECQELAQSLLPPQYVKLKCNKPCGPLVGWRPDDAEHSLTQCDCDPNEEGVCGPYTSCLNRMLLTECGPSCRAGDRCNNRAFEKRQYPRMVPYRTPHRGWGLKSLEDIKQGQFVIEYVGELIDLEEFQRRMRRKHEVRDENYYFLTLDKERMIDAGPKGNLARFMNHCCEPNCETQKWTVLGDVRVGLFALRDIPANSELTFNYNLESDGIEKKRCLCGARRCAGYIGAKPKQEEQVKKGKIAGKRVYKKRKPIEESPTTSFKSKPKPRLTTRSRPKELTDIEKDLLIIKSATNGISSDSEASGRLGSVESERKDNRPPKRKRVDCTDDEPPSPHEKRLRIVLEKSSVEVGD